MKEQTTIATRLRNLMEAQGLGENELARRCKVPQPTIHRILSGASQSPRISNLEKIAAALGTSVSYLAHGGEPPAIAASLGGARVGGVPAIVGVGVTGGLLSLARRGAHPSLNRYPVLSMSDVMPSAQARKGAISEQRPVEASDHKALGQAFWLRVQGDAMSAPIGVSPSLPDGTLVLLDTELPAVPGKLVLAALPDSPETTLRQLIEEGGQRYLKPLNPAYPLTVLKNGYQILAVAIEAKIKL